MCVCQEGSDSRRREGKIKGKVPGTETSVLKSGRQCVY